jgi:hypothetical protein
MEYVAISGIGQTGDVAWPDEHLVVPIQVMCGPEHSTPPAPPAVGAVEHATPPTASLGLDEDVSDTPHHFIRTLDNVLGLASPPGLANREVTEELLAAINDRTTIS